MRVARNARRALGRRPGDGRLRRLVARLEESTAQTHRLLEQTRQRLRGNRVIADRLISLAAPDARPIRKGKPQHPTQFGYTLLLAEDERGFVADHQLSKGNPADAPQLLPAVRRVAALRGRPPGTVVADRGFGFAAGDRALAQLGVRRIGLQRTGTPSRSRHQLEQTRAFKRLRNWASGSKPASATSSAPSAATHPATPPCRRADLGGAWDLRLQPAADDSGHTMSDHPAGRAARPTPPPLDHP